MCRSLSSHCVSCPSCADCIAVVASLLASLRHYEIAVPVRVDGHGARHRTERRSRRSSARTSTSSSVVDTDQGSPSSTRGKCMSTRVPDDRMVRARDLAPPLLVLQPSLSSIFGH